MMADQKRAAGVKALVFDAYGTLFDVHSVIAACDEMFPEQGQALSQLWRAKQLEYSWLLSLMERYEDFWQVTERALRFACQTLRLSCQPAQQARLLEAYLSLATYPEVQPALAALVDYPQAILSNGSPPMLQAVIESAGLSNIFAHVISVAEVGIYKPSPRVYRLVPAKLGVEPAAIGFISSNSFDIIGAASFGFRTYWVNRAGQPLDELGFSPDETLRGLMDLVGILQD